jgi:hypothetical protein
MELREAIQTVLAGLPDDKVREVPDFAMFIAQENDANDWRAFGQSQFAQAYGDDEPEYSEADLKPSTAP